MAENRDGVPVWPGAVFGFIFGWLLVSAFRNPLRALIIIGVTVGLYYLMSGIDTAQDVLHDNQVGSSVTVTLPEASEANIVKASCPDEAPNVGEPFLC